jgi:hypothetical protein
MSEGDRGRYDHKTRAWCRGLIEGRGTRSAIFLCFREIETYLAISEDCTCWGSSVLSGVDSVGLGGSYSDN